MTDLLAASNAACAAKGISSGEDFAARYGRRLCDLALGKALEIITSEPVRTCAPPHDEQLGDRGDGIAAVKQLSLWLDTGRLAALPERVPGFTGELESYSDRDRLISLVRMILHSVPWSLTARDLAVQFVSVLAPIIEGQAP